MQELMVGDQLHLSFILSINRSQNCIKNSRCDIDRTLGMVFYIKTSIFMPEPRFQRQRLVIEGLCVTARRWAL